MTLGIGDSACKEPSNSNFEAGSSANTGEKCSVYACACFRNLGSDRIAAAIRSLTCVLILDSNSDRIAGVQTLNSDYIAVARRSHRHHDMTCACTLAALAQNSGS